jgi:hypothetical protein
MFVRDHLSKRVADMNVEAGGFVKLGASSSKTADSR